MTKHRDVIKCRQEKYKMAALISTSGYEMANKPKVKKKERMVKMKGNRERIQQHHSEKKEEASNVSEQRDKGCIHVTRVHDTTHLAVIS